MGRKTNVSKQQTRFDGVLESISLSFQPIVRCSEKSVLGFEAFVRCAEPDLCDGAKILATAGKLGRVDELGRRIREVAAQSVGDLPENALLFVNVHPDEFSKGTFFNSDNPLFDVARRIVVEVPDDTSDEAFETLTRHLQSLRAMGFRFSIDNIGRTMGCGFLKHLDPDYVKLDRSVVQDLQTLIRKHRVSAALIKLFARDLGLAVIGTGVETAATRDLLAFQGCDLQQGYLYAKPGQSFAPPRLGSLDGLVEDRAAEALADQAIAVSTQSQGQDPALRAMQELVGIFIHEFRGSLSGVLLPAELALEDQGDEEERTADINGIIASARAAQTTLDRLGFLADAFTKSGCCNLNDVVRGMQSVLGELFKSNVQFEYTADPCQVSVGLRGVEHLLLTGCILLGKPVAANGGIVLRTRLQSRINPLHYAIEIESCDRDLSVAQDATAASHWFAAQLRRAVGRLGGTLVIDTNGVYNHVTRVIISLPPLAPTAKHGDNSTPRM